MVFCQLSSLIFFVGAEAEAADATVTDHSLLEKAGIRAYKRRSLYAVRDTLQGIDPVRGSSNHPFLGSQNFSAKL